MESYAVFKDLAIIIVAAKFAGFLQGNARRRR